MRAVRIAAACSVTFADALMILEGKEKGSERESQSTKDDLAKKESQTHPSISLSLDSNDIAFTLDERSGVFTPPVPCPEEDPACLLISPDENPEAVRCPLVNIPSISLSSERLLPISIASIP